jgi:hypothetical protein
MSWDEPTQEEYDDAVVEDTVHCARCGCSYVLPEGYLFGDRSVCVECTQGEIDELIRQRDEARKECAAWLGQHHRDMARLKQIDAALGQILAARKAGGDEARPDGPAPGAGGMED